MQFEAEFADPDRVQPFFYDVERGFLFRDEQHAFAVRQSVCDNIRNGLALARAGRPVQHKTRARRRKRYGGKLRTIGRQRQQDLFGIALVLFERRNVLFLRPSRKQSRNDFILFKFVDVYADIVPHQIILEGKTGKVDVVHDVPPLHARRFRAYHG